MTYEAIVEEAVERAFGPRFENGYAWMTAPPKVCQRCGCAVADEKRHNGWHAVQEAR